MSSVRKTYRGDCVTLREVGLRDGLQTVAAWPDTAAKLAWLHKEHAAGVRHFEVGSFLPPSSFPQFADVREIAKAAHVLDGTHTIALTINARGQSDALSAAVDEITCVVSATEEHNQANVNCSREKSLKTIANAVAERNATGSDTLVGVGIAMAFGCSIAGHVSEDAVIRLAEGCLENGVDLVGVADTVGYAGPRQIASLCARLEKLCDGHPFLVHLHDTRGMAIANAAAAIDSGARILDGSLGGLGGCPFAPGATGNVAMEDLAFLCASMGVKTGVDVERLLQVREILQDAMPNETLTNGLAKAGLPKTWSLVRDAS